MEFAASEKVHLLQGQLPAAFGRGREEPEAQVTHSLWTGKEVGHSEHFLLSRWRPRAGGLETRRRAFRLRAA